MMELRLRGAEYGFKGLGSRNEWFATARL
jgi:hypothetical protein